MSSNVVIYEVSLDFLAGLSGAQGRPMTPEDQSSLLSPEVLEQVKQRLSGLSSVLEMNPLAVLVVAHVGTPAPDPMPEPSADAPADAGADEDGGGRDADDVASRVRRIQEKDAEHLNAVQARMSTLFSLEPLLDSVREAAEPAASLVEFVPHSTWLGEVEAFGQRIRTDETENKVFLLENLAAIPEELGVIRISQIPPKKAEEPVDPKAKGKAAKDAPVEPPPDEDPPAPKIVRLSWAAREAWAKRVFRILQPEVLVQDSFDAVLQNFTINTGLWRGAPLRVTGPAVEAEFQSLVETLPALGRSGAADAAGDKAEEAAEGSPAPMMIAIGGGGFQKPGGETTLLQKLKLVIGLSQFNLLEKYGVILSLGGEFAVCVIADLLGVKVGSRSFQPSVAVVAAMREAFLEVLAKSGAKVVLPIDLCCEEKGAEPPAVGDGDVRPRTSHSLASAFAAAARAPVSLGVLDGKQYWAVVDPATGALKASDVAPSEGEFDMPDADEATLGVPDGWQVQDIGDASIESALALLKRCRGILWNGALGVWEGDDRWQQGTRRLLAAVESRLLGGEEEEEEADEEEEGEEGEDGADKPERVKPEPDAEFEVALVIGRDSAQLLPTLMETPSLVQFVSQSGDALLQMLRGEELPGLLVCAERTAN